jgi:hypothetical protein
MVERARRLPAITAGFFFLNPESGYFSSLIECS